MTVTLATSTLSSAVLQLDAGATTETQPPLCWGQGVPSPSLLVPKVAKKTTKEKAFEPLNASHQGPRWKVLLTPSQSQEAGG